ncbi:type I polyketide synthase [Kitasatospora purpeofusca]|uniref:type I polyketide synthase n=1 Tax=Kitasatospora purpeofusca TaxID=67352 RepID=UPI002E0D9788|nr:type I polyketide synthase [Kitasatospora purpeofusca]
MSGDQTIGSTHDTAIAVIGASCRVPSASGPAAFWRLLTEGTDALSPWPEQRGPGGASWTGGFLDEVGTFDAAFFGVGPDEAAAMDPQQRLALELVWEAMEDAGLPDHRLRGSRTGVFVGVSSDDYAALAARGDRAGHGELHDFTGRHRAVVANRVSWTLGLQGPSLAVDAAQASSLVAVHLACESIRRGESDLAFAGGVNLILSPDGMRAAAGLGALSAKGRCAVFDESADGFVRGEGGGVVLLKPLAQAVADGDPVYCVIRGSAVNNDGGGERLSDPDVAGQQQVLRQAYANAGIGTEAVQYVELHGTGTPVGDPVEAAAVSAVIGRGADGRRPLRVGSVKTNIGHLEAAAGIVGLLKAALALRHRRLPASLHFRTANPAIPLDELNLRVQTELDAWPDPEVPLVAGVSSFGIGGTNCHVVLTEGPYAGHPTDVAAPAGGAAQVGTASTATATTPATARGPLPWVLSARSGRALEAQAGKLLAHLDATAGAAEADAAGIARSLATGRSVFEHRAVVLGTDRSDLTARLERLHEEAVSGLAAPAGRTAFLFAGGGAHRVGMGRELYAAHPVFAEALDEVLAHLDPALGLREVLFGERADAAAALDGMRRMQPALFAFQVALYRLVTSWGVEPDLLVGHSFGEIVAAHVSGALSLPEAAALAAARGELMEALPAGGAMIAVEATEEEALAALDGVTDVSIGVINGPASVVLSGAEESVARIADDFRDRGRRTTRLRVRNAAHSPLTLPMLDEYARRIDGLTVSEPSIPIVSTVTGRTGTPMTEEYWIGHVGATVRFHDAITACRELGVTRFVELGPDATLTPLVRPDETELAVALQHRDRPEPQTLLTGLAQAWVSGATVDWAGIIGAAPTVDLPTYAFQRERYWLDERPAAPAAEQHLSSATLALRDRIRTEPEGFLRRWLTEHLAGSTGGTGFAADETFRDLGFDSVLSVQLRNRLASATGLRLPASVLFDYPTPNALTAYLHERIVGVLDADEDRPTAAPVAATDEDPIAVVGMACHLPGGIDSPQQLWQAVLDGTDAISEFPTDRGWDLAGLYHPDPANPGTSYARHGGFLSGASEFDADFFGISPREAAAMDPQQRLLLETAWEALERAGVNPDGLRGSRTGVFVGAMGMEYGPRLNAPVDGTEGFRLTGTTTSVASGRISYLLGLEGPAMTVDTACSSSLVALHLAVQALRNGECSLALAGGVTVLSTPGMFVEFSRQRGLAADGRCKAFSDDADGTGWGEGVGLLVVERLSDARRNGHQVLAVVRGSAVNQDGGSNGLTAPNGPSQQRVIRGALANARLGAADVDAVEAHGTGTTLGDPIEAQALLATYGQGREAEQPLWLGSLKSNIGHTQAAAGVAGVIKMIEAMRHGVMPRTLHADTPSHHVDWESGAVSLLTEQRDWPESDRPRRSAVSSFGISGTNAHVILEAAPEEPAAGTEAPVAGSPGAAGDSAAGDGPVPWVLSARSETALTEQAARLLERITDGTEPDLHDVAFTLTAGRALLDHRAVVVGDDRDELVERLREFTTAGASAGVISGRVGPGSVNGAVFVFPGQGSQWIGMARELLDFSPVFAGKMTECAAALEPFADGWSLLDVVRDGEEGSLDRVDVVQPVLFAVMVSLAELWRSLGVKPTAVVGHSQGEIAAAHVAGALTLDDAARIVALRSRAILRLSGRGGMLSVLAPQERIHEHLTAGLQIAVVNGPEQVVVSGAPEELDTLAARCETDGIQARRIAVDYASHSPQVEELREELLHLLAPVTPRTGHTPLISTVTGEAIDTATMDAAYWFTNLRETVRFDTALTTLLTTGHRVFVETSPHPVLTGPVTQAAENTGTEGVHAIGTLRRGEGGQHRLLHSLAEAHTTGLTVDWTPWTGAGRLTDLPTYAFQHRRHWLPASATATDVGSIGLGTVDHPLLGASLQLANGESVLTGRISLSSHPWLADHAVFGTVVLPGTAFVELALHAADRVGHRVLDELTLERPLVLTDTAHSVIQVTVASPDTDGRRTVTIHSRPHTTDTDPTDPTDDWTRHAVGTLSDTPTTPAPYTGTWPPTGAQRIDTTDSYQRLSTVGYGYGPTFQGLTALWQQGQDLYAEVVLPTGTDGFALHPALLDAALHPLLADELLVPFSWNGVQLHATDATTLRVHLTRRGEGAARLTAYDTTGHPVVTVDDLRLQPMSADQLATTTDEPLYELRWHEIPRPQSPVVPEDIALARVEAEGDLFTRLTEVLEITQQFLTDPANEDTRLVVVTQGSLTDHPDPVTAAVWGLLRSAQTEQPGRIVLIDVDIWSEEAFAAAIATGEPQVAFRAGQLFVPRLALASAGTYPAPAWNPDGTVLITGASGTLGRLVARHLVTEHGVRRLLLLSRSGARGSEEFAAELLELGATPAFVACDVADRDQLAAALAGIPAEHPLTAVVHAAGVLDDAAVTNLGVEQLANVLRPKTDAADLLHELTAGADLAAFVLFSSVAGVIGTAGQANYAAANAYLDALAQDRHAAGLPATSLAWGLWADASSMTGHLDSADLGRLTRTGLAPLTTTQGLNLLDRALTTTHPTLVPARLDHPTLRNRATENTLPTLYRNLVRTPTRPTATTHTQTGTWTTDMAALTPEERHTTLITLLHHHINTVLGHTTTDTTDTPDTERPFRDMGFDSLTGLELRTRLQNTTGLRLPSTLVFDYPTLTTLAHHLDQHIQGTTTHTPTTHTTTTDHDPIVIVGMACHLPGGIDSPQQLWQAVLDGTDAISEFPTDRGWDTAGLYDPDPGSTGKTYSTRGGFLSGASEFDADFFGISPREATAMDPQQRLLLETSWEALERAGIDPATLRGSRTGVFAGLMYHDYGTWLSEASEDVEGLLITGSSGGVASGRISYLLGLEGPAMTVDTACSSSLVTLHLAVQALRNGECSLALAGGVTVMATPTTFVEFSRQRAMSPDGRCKAFSDDADGAGWSEGVGMLVVERLSDAERLGHRVLAVVRGSAVNQDGASNGLTAPNGPSQQRVIRDALANARLTPADVDLVEAHGTGTALGDPIEAQALLATYGQEHDAERPLWLGSVKSNIGHTQAAAGVAGVIKMVEAMRHGVMPRTLHAGTPSHHVDWESGAVSLLTEQQEWPELDRPRRSAVSSFGIGGTNAHVVLEAASDEPAPESAEVAGDGAVPWVLSARSEAALTEQAARLLERITDGTEPDLHDVAFTLTAGRTLLDHRAVVVGDGREELAERLKEFVSTGSSAGVVTGRAGSPGTVFVFPGQGSQWIGMARELLDFSPVFAGKMTECAAALEPFADGWSLLDVVRDDNAHALDRVDVVQPVLFAVMVSLAELWRSLGVKPTAVVGHSQGEIAAAHVAGALTLQDAARIVALRSRAILRLSGRGGMLSVLAPQERIHEHLTAGLQIAVVNGPEQVVVSGTPEELDTLAARCETDGIQARRIAVDYASHSPQVEELREELLHLLAPVTPRTGHTPLISTVTGEAIDTATMDAGYWFTNLRETVRFDTALTTLLTTGHRVFVETSPHPVLTGPVTQAAENTGTEGVHAIGTLRRGEGGQLRLLHSLAEAHTTGLTVDWTPWTGAGHLTDLPTYAFQHRRHWLPAAKPVLDATGLGLNPAGHPLLGAAVRLASQDGLVLTGQVSLGMHPWLADHGVFGAVVLPGTAFVELALHAADRVGHRVLDELTLERPLVLTDTAQSVIQVTVASPDTDGRRTVTIHSRPHTTDTDPTDPTDDWTRHAVGTLTDTPTDNPAPYTGTWPPTGAQRIDTTDAYERLSALGYGYGPAFQGLTALWQQGQDLYAEVVLPTDSDGFALHPALLDAALHPLPAGDLWVPFSWNGVQLHATDATTLRVHLTRRSENAAHLTAYDTTGHPVVTVDDLRLQRMSADQLATTTDEPLYRIGWSQLPTPQNPAAPSGVTVARVAPGGELRDRLTEILELTQQFLGDRANDDTRLAVVTQGSLTDRPDPVTAAVWGLLRSAQTEHPDRILLIDVDTWSESALATAVATGEPQVAVRGSEVLAPRLTLVAPNTEDTAAPAAWNPNGTVLITGASGTLGRLVARHLVTEHGVRRLLLLSRSGTAAPQDLLDTGAHVTVRACDVADRDQLAAALADIPTEHPLTAVVHTAGVLDDGVLEALTPERLDTVLRPKADAVHALHDLTADTDLAAFVLFSSAAGVLGSAGQANYAAANAYLDALAQQRHAAGLPATSLAWGLWADASSMTGHLDSADLGRLTRTGLAPLTTTQGLNLLDRALTTTHPTLVPARLDHPTLRNRATENTLPTLYRNLVRTPTRPTATTHTQTGTWTTDMAALTPEERHTTLITLLHHHINTVLGHTTTDTTDTPDTERPFRDMGFDSLTGLELRTRLQNTTGLRLPSTLVFDYPTLTTLAHHLDQHIQGTTTTHTPTTHTTTTDHDPIVIVGMACRYPGDITSPQDLWRAALDGADVISDFPTDRGWDLANLYDPDPEAVGRTYTRKGGFLQDAAVFEPEFFGISPREATAMDPQQRLLLETSWEALERAGIDPATLRGSRTGVFAGLMAMEYGPPLHEPIEGMDGFRMLGSSSSVASGRISYLLGLEGPAMTVDTACSSSLVALHLAAQALRNGECTLAVAGGVTVMSTPTTFVEFSRQRAMSPDGRCKAFSDDADGAGWSEGVGMLVVERLSDARRNGHQVLAVVRGSAVNQDGGSNGLTAPNGPAQQRVIQDALAGARLTGADVDVVEAHGTGTALGDPIEAQALLATYGQEHDAEHPLWLGSLKSNLGHTQAAAGVAGIIKMVQAMRHGVMPRTLHAGTPSHHVDWESGAVSLLTEQQEWPELDRPRRSAVSSFGISGTNAHVILEAAPEEPAGLPAQERPGAAPAVAWALSAKTPDALRRQAGRLLERLTDGTDGSGPDPRDVGHTLAVGRAVLDHRAVLLGTGREELTGALAALARGEESPAVVSGRTGAAGAGGLAMVFSGQGSQRAGMGRELYERYPVFAEAFDAVCRTVDEQLDGHAEHPLRDVVFAEAGTPVAALLNQSMYTQTGLFALEVALLALLEERGVTPDYVMGHSLGEITAAYAAGVLTLPDACALVAARGRLMQALPTGGAMVAIEAAEQEAEAYIAGAGLADAVGIAAVNGPLAVVVSGDEEAAVAVAEHFRAAGHRVRRLSVSHAFHSHRMDAMLDGFAEVLAGLTFRAPLIPVVSNVTGGLIDAERFGTPQYWVDHVRGAVRFADGVRCLAGHGITAFLEVGPEAVVTPMVHATLDEELGRDGFVAVAALTAGRPEPLALTQALARQFVAGVPVPWERTVPGGRLVELPGHVFAGQRYWQDAVGSTAGLQAAGLHATRHPLLGAAVHLPDGQAVLTGRVLPGSHPWLADHAVDGTVLLPGTAFLDLALHAADAVGCRLVEELTLEAPLVLPTEAAVYLQVAVGAADEAGRRSVTVHSSASPASATEPSVRHATGVLSSAPAQPAGAWPWPPADARPVPVEGLYEELAGRGYGYGPVFQGLRAAWTTSDALYAEVELPSRPDGFGIHPALLDAALHAVTLGVPSLGGTESTAGAAGAGRPLLPFSWAGVSLEASGATAVRVRLAAAGDDTVALTAVDTTGRPVITVDALTLRRMSATAPDRDGGLHLRWRAVPAGRPGSAPADVTVAMVAPGGDLRARLTEVLVQTQKFLTVSGSVDGRLAVVTQGTMAERPDPVTAAVWGLLRSAQAENPDRILLIDVDTWSEEAFALAVDSGEPQVAVRGRQVLVPRLSRSAPPAPDPDVPGDRTVPAAPRALDPEGTVLITGASGTLGRLVARHLVTEHGVRRLLLLSRSGTAAPQDLLDTGAHVTVRACDVADREQLAAVLREIPEEFPLTAVVHTAGVLDDGVLEAMTPERLDTVLRPKADAVHALHDLTADTDLAAFVLFSSAAGVLGSAGQANYAAANAYLDALAQQRHAAGLPATSLAWGLWAEASGMTEGLAAADLGRIARTGLRPTSTEEGLAAFDRALLGTRPVVVPVAVDPAALDADSAPPLLRDLVPAPRRRAAAAGAVAVAEETLADRLRGLSPEQRHELVLGLVLADVAHVLGYGDAHGVSPEGAFRDLGFDSLTAVELRNRINDRTGLKLGVTAVFDHPSPRELADHLLDRLAPAPAEAADAGEPDYERVLADLARIRTHLAALDLTGTQRTTLTETLRDLSEPWSGGPSGISAEEPAGLASASAAEVLDFVTNSLGISVSGDEAPTDLI